MIKAEIAIQIGATVKLENLEDLADMGGYTHLISHLITRRWKQKALWLMLSALLR